MASHSGVAGVHTLTETDLHAHFTAVIAAGAVGVPGVGGAPAVVRPTDILRELGRMLLAQLVGHSHNVAVNNDPAYAEQQADDIHLQCVELHNHLLIHGHLGYYPGISFIPEGNANQAIQQKVNTLVARGIFNINKTVANRVYNNTKLNYLSPVTNLGYEVDSADNESPVDLKSIGYGLINKIFSTDRINPTQITLGAVTPGPGGAPGTKFTLEVTYTGKEISGVTESSHIGFSRENRSQPTNVIKIVVAVDGGVIKIITIYPV